MFLLRIRGFRKFLEAPEKVLPAEKSTFCVIRHQNIVKLIRQASYHPWYHPLRHHRQSSLTRASDIHEHIRTRHHPWRVYSGYKILFIVIIFEANAPASLLMFALADQRQMEQEEMLRRLLYCIHLESHVIIGCLSNDGAVACAQC